MRFDHTDSVTCPALHVHDQRGSEPVTDHYDVRVGDRYIRGDERMTVSRIDGAVIEGTVMTGVGPSGAVWTMTYALPLDAKWTRVGRGPEIVKTCINHPLREREVGTMLCPECVDQHAASWSGLSPGHAEALYASLLKEKK
jgi:hypothetical protein